MNIENQIESELKKYYDFFTREDWKEFGDYLDGDFKYYTDKCIIQTKSELIDLLKKNEWKNTGYKISDLSLIVSEKEDLVVAIYKIEFNGYEGSDKLTLYATETTVFGKKADGWKVLHSHTSNKV